ncbi:MAG: hypothetical protein ACE5DN_00655, partial [Flavobacteriales bacterium]
KKHIGNVGSFLESVLSFALRIIAIFFKAFGKLIGVVFIIAGTVALTVFMYSIFSGSQMITSIRPDGLQYFSWQDISGLLFSNADQGWLAIAGIALLVGIPLISIVYSGLKILFNFRNDIKIAGIFLTSLFLSGLIMCLIAGLQLSRDFSYAESTTSTLNLDSCTSDTLFLELTQGTCGKAGRNGETGGQLNFDGEALYIDGPRMDIISSNTDSFEVSITRSAKGSTKKDAYNRARNISYRTSGNDCHIGFGPCYSIEKDDKWRVQQLDIEVRVPEGKTVFIAKGMEQIIYDIQNATNTRDKDMPGHFWTVKSGVLTCADCSR